MLANGDATSDGMTRRGSAAQSMLTKTTALSGLILLWAIPSADAYYRPAFVAAPRPVMAMPAYRPAARPIVSMPVVRPAPRPMAVPVYRPAVRPMVAPVAKPAVRPVAPSPYRPATVSAARPLQSTVRPPAVQARPAPVMIARPAASPVIVRPSPTPAPVSARPSLPTAAATTLRPSTPMTPAQPMRPPAPGIVTGNAQSTPPVATPSPLASKVATTAAVGLGAAAQFPQSRPGQVVTNSLAAAGGEILKSTPLSVTSDAVGVANAYLTSPTRTDGLIAAGSQLSGEIAVGAAGRLGGPLGAAGMQALVTAGDIYVAPALGNAMFNAAPGLFTPPSKAQVNILAAPAPSAHGALTAEQMNDLLVMK
jgi:hypothetical protein